MAREILFRGRTRDGKKWFCGDLVQNGGLIRIWEKDDSNGMWVVDPDTVCQYTGLTDENGRKIFEGDIARACGDTYIVFWDGKNCEIGVKNDRESLGIAYLHPGDMEIVGNIFDDPGLIEERRDR